MSRSLENWSKLLTLGGYTLRYTDKDWKLRFKVTDIGNKGYITKKDSKVNYRLRTNFSNTLDGDELIDWDDDYYYWFQIIIFVYLMNVCI